MSSEQTSAPEARSVLSRADMAPVKAARLFVNDNPRVVTAWCCLILAALATGAAFYAARAYLLPIVAAFVLSVMFAPGVNWLERRGTPRALASVLAVAFVCTLFYVTFALVAAPAARWITNSPEIIESAREHLERVETTVEAVEEISQEVEQLTQNPDAQSVVVEGPSLTTAIAASARTIVVQALFVLVLTYFFILTRKDIRLKVIAAQPRLAGRLHVARVFRDVERGVAVYISTLAAVNLGLGAAVALAMWLLGVPNPIMWGGLAAALNFVPFIGPAVTTVLLAAAGLSTFETLSGALAPAAAYVALNFIESNAVTPVLLGRRMTLNPLAIILAISFWTWIWGPVGGVLSVPMLIMIKVLCDHTTALRPLGSFIGGPLPRRSEHKPMRELKSQLFSWRFRSA